MEPREVFISDAAPAESFSSLWNLLWIPWQSWFPFLSLFPALDHSSLITHTPDSLHVLGISRETLEGSENSSMDRGDKSHPTLILWMCGLWDTATNTPPCHGAFPWSHSHGTIAFEPFPLSHSHGSIPMDLFPRSHSHGSIPKEPFPWSHCL